MHSLYSLLEQALLSRDPEQKCRLVRELAERSAQRPPLEKNAAPPLDFREAGRPDKPNLVPPSAVTPRKMNTPEGYAAMLHAICHIEFNAINLALDAAYRFRLLRMALVPRVLEARGLDVTPGIRAKVAQRGDTETCGVLDIIYRDEVGHVKIGNYWYQHLCRQRGLEPMALFRNLLSHYDMFVFRGYVNLDAREKAGFSRFELELLHDFEQSMKTDNPPEGKRAV